MLSSCLNLIVLSRAEMDSVFWPALPADDLFYGGRIRGWKWYWVTARRSFKGGTFLPKNWVCSLLSADVVRNASYLAYIPSHVWKAGRGYARLASCTAVGVICRRVQSRLA